MAKDSVKSRLDSERGMSLHGVFVPAAAGVRLRATCSGRSTTCMRAGRRQRPVGEHHRRHRPHPADLAAGQGRRVRAHVPAPAQRPTVSKFGKSEDGAVWLSPDRLSPYKFYQHLLQSTDADVVRFMTHAHLRAARRDRGHRGGDERGRLRPEHGCVSSIQKFFTHRSVSTFDRVPFQLTGELFLYGMAHSAEATRRRR